MGSKCPNKGVRKYLYRVVNRCRRKSASDHPNLVTMTKTLIIAGMNSMKSAARFHRSRIASRYRNKYAASSQTRCATRCQRRSVGTSHSKNVTPRQSNSVTTSPRRSVAMSPSKLLVEFVINYFQKLVLNKQL